LKSGAETISSGLDQTKTELTSISAGLVTIQSSVTSSQTGLTKVSSIINNYILNHPDSANELQLASDTMSKLNNGLLQVNGSMSQLNTGINSLSLGIGSLESGQAQLVSGLTTLKYGLEAAGSGSSDLAAGNAKLISGSTTLSSGISTLSSGTSTLSTGLSTAKNGITQLKDSLTTGADKITASTESNKVATETAVMASPVSVTNKSYDLVANYGSGFAPYFISLALWVGALLSFFVIDFDKKPMTKAITIARYIIIAIIGIAQAIILDLVLKNVLGLSVINQWQYYAFTILMSLTFMSILQLLIQQLANIGRYTAIILLILQLTSAAGTFPKETLPMFFQIINPLLPMTYSILGIRDILFTNDLSNLWSPVLYFVAMLFVSLLLNLFITKKKSTKSALEAL
jgi:putative membrane protein